jgi:hypothetical protein
MHTAHKHAPEGTHMHIHDDGFTHTSHHVKEDGKVEGPHEHSSPEEAGEHVKQVFGGMEHEGATPEAGAMGHLGMNSHPAKLMSGI